MQTLPDVILAMAPAGYSSRARFSARPSSTPAEIAAACAGSCDPTVPIFAITSPEDYFYLSADCDPFACAPSSSATGVEIFRDGEIFATCLNTAVAGGRISLACLVNEGGLSHI